MVKSRSLSWRLGILALAVILPLVVFALMMRGETTRKALGDRSLPREPGISAPLEFREATGQAPGSIVSHSSISGQKVAYVPVSADSTVGVAAGASKLALGPGAFLLTTILAALAITGSLVLSYLNSRALARKMRELESRTQTVFTGAPIATAPTGVREFDGLGDALARTSEFLSLRSDQQRDADQGLQTSQELQTSEEHFQASGRQPAAAGLDGASRRPHRLYQRAPRKIWGNRADRLGRHHPSGRSAGDGGSVAPRERGRSSPMKWSTACLRSEKDTRGT